MTEGDMWLADPRALAYLSGCGLDAAAIDVLVGAYRTWSGLVASTAVDRVRLLGHRGAALHVPPSCPADAVERSVGALSRYDPKYPARLLDLPDPPVLLWVRGTFPTGPMVAVVGAECPSPVGVEISRSAARSAAAAGVPVVAEVGPGCGRVALQAAAEAGAPAVGVVPYGLGVAAPQAALCEQLLAAGGAVVSECAPEVGSDAATVRRSARLVAALASAVVLAEVGLSEPAGVHRARSAVRLGRFLIVPTGWLPERYLPASAAGLPLFTSARSWTGEVFGTSMRIEARCAAGLPPADAVITDHAQLSAAIATGSSSSRR